MPTANTSIRRKPPITFDPSGIPKTLAIAERWMIYRAKWGGRKWIKKPTAAGYLNPANLTTLEAAVALCGEGEFPGFVLGGGYCCVDVDECLSPHGELAPESRVIVDKLDAYTSVSMSGGGLHIVCHYESTDDLFDIGSSARVPFEFYTCNRFIALMGRGFEDRETLPLASDLSSIHKLISPHRPKPPRAAADWQHWSDVYPQLTGEQLHLAAAAYVKKIEPSVEGSGGSITMMKVCSVLRWGFLLNLEEAHGILGKYAARCEPPYEWRDVGVPESSSIEHKWESTLQGKGQMLPPGNLLVRLDPFREIYDDDEFDANAPTSFAGKDASEFASLLHQPIPWLIPELLAADESLVLGAAEKSCKTLFNLELAVSLATGTPFMAHWPVERRHKVLFITGETNGRRTAQQLEAACQARGLSFADLKGWLHVEVDAFPMFINGTHFEAIQRDIRRHKFEVTILDPIYPALEGLEQNQLSSIGSALRRWVVACKPAAVVASHHATKAGSAVGVIPERRDLTGAGIRETFGQWWLIGRLSEFNPETRVHEFGVDFGGRDCWVGRRRIVFDEQRWQFEITNYTDHRASEIAAQIEVQKQAKGAQKQLREDARRKEGLERVEADVEQIRRFMESHTDAKPKCNIEAGSGIPQLRFRRAFIHLESAGHIEQASYLDAQKRTQKGWVLHDSG